MELLVLVLYLGKICRKSTRQTNRFVLYLMGVPFICPLPFCTAAQVLWAYGRLKIKKRLGVITEEDNIFREMVHGGCCCGPCKVLEDARVLETAPLYDEVATDPMPNDMHR